MLVAVHEGGVGDIEEAEVLEGPLAQAADQIGDGGSAQAQRLQLDDLVTFEGAQTFHRQLGGVLQSHMSAITGEVRL